jgi:hypothetical protein
VSLVRVCYHCGYPTSGDHDPSCRDANSGVVTVAKPTAPSEVDALRAEVKNLNARIADVGLLLPPDIEPNRQYGRLIPNGHILPTSQPDPTHYRLLGPWRPIEEATDG